MLWLMPFVSAVEELLTHPAAPSPKSSQSAAKERGPPIPIRVPANSTQRPAPLKPQPSTSEDMRETFDMRVAETTTEYRITQEDTDKALRDLMSDVRNDIKEEIDMSESVVPGFRDGILLLPHQIVGRKWMAERETGKRTGGILADDMG